MTGRAIVILALAATGLLVVGARLLESPTAATMVLAIVALAAGTALAAAAVAGAWRTPAPAEQEPEPPATHGRRGGRLRGQPAPRRPVTIEPGRR